jgi:hypothetical protein
MSTSQVQQKTGTVPTKEMKADVMDDHLRYLEEMVEKSVEISQIVKDLTDSHTEHKTNYYRAGGTQWMTQADIDAIFESATKNQEEMALALEDMKALIEDAKSTFAVDAPDGETDWHVKAEMKEIKHIIDEASEVEDPAVIQAKHEADADFFRETKHTTAVDAPDGDPDWYLKDQMAEIPGRHCRNPSET